ncbi:hypothetical protein ABIC83_002593 [Roseateles asaccharophilus]|uniref:hypothetical protein n=1 Tax=Roseateles asaccharophilus TaxID=582607 RepID=UPI00383583DE
MAQTSITDRLAATRRRQGRAIAGLNPVEEPIQPPVSAAEADDWVPHLSVGARPQVLLRERAGQVREFECLLPVVARHYAYSEADIQHVRSQVLDNSPAGEMELALCIRQWRLDAVSYRFDDQLPPGAGRRARIQFRQDIMGMTHDENGEPYMSFALDWAPEEVGVSMKDILGMGKPQA